uniref:Uncharacterized protein n=1 Tax=Leersia perrieri TaxID=77586 RepID=A0A0D9XSP3_9ORYZ
MAAASIPIPRAAPPPNPHPLLLLLRPPALVRLHHLRLRLPPPRRARVAAAATATAAAASVAPDDIPQINHRLRALVRRRVASSSSSSSLAASSSFDPAQAEAYLSMIREQQRMGLRQLRRDDSAPEEEGESDDGGRRGRKGAAAGSSLGHRVDPRELEAGEYVVHKKVGVGKFVCISAEDGVDYVFIQYADAMAKLAVDQAARMLYRYNLPHEKQRPRNLSKLNDPSTWEKRRLKGKLAVQKMVVNLMELYLQRMRQKRPPYPKPVGMDQFTAEFPYDPTPDQNQAFIDVEKDLTERETPMDRLICGDVGFGKTEVAMRAIFIVISAGFQAMVLAPTVILAKQHYDVMSERFSNYPDIQVAMFSGAQTKEEKDELITKIKNGDLQIIVGTHAVLTERMAYNNLGLLVVDEEQKFGVQQKEKIASYKASIDVLTLSATPIPRTLYLALTAIDDVLQYLQDSLPDVPIAVAHGKLRGRVGRSGTEGFAYLFYTDKSLLSKIATDRLEAIEEHSDLGQGFHVAEKDMGIRGFGSMFGEQQSGDVANVGIDLFFDMLFDSLSKVDQFCLIPVPYKDVQMDVNISSRLSSEYISYLENPVELLNEAAKAAEKDLWTLMQFTEDLRRQYGKEPRDMELLLKKLYVRRMAADLGISRIYSSGKTIIMKTNMNKKVFRLMREAMSLETHRNSLSFTGKEIKAELLVNLPDTLLLNWLFHCLADCYAVIPALVKY